MPKKLFCRVALPLPLRRFFDYLPPKTADYANLIPGVRVKVPFQARQLVGVLVAMVQESAVPHAKLKPVTEILDHEPIFTEELYKLCQWGADYYHGALGEVFAHALPTLLRKGHAIPPGPFFPNLSPTIPEVALTLNAAQQEALQKLLQKQATFAPILLNGVTGSGKTEIYLQLIARMIAADKQVLVLVPEISLTPQTIARFSARFNVPIVALHSHFSDKERMQAWAAARAGEARIVIGTRSAIFTPFQALGLIIIDEEHDASFKQQDRWRYHARDLAMMRAYKLQIPIVLGSATPSLETWLNVKRGRYEMIHLPMRAGDASLPQYQTIDIRSVQIEQGLSPQLLRAMQTHLQQGQQVMLFLNRRGFAPVYYCTQCAWMVDCKRCETHMVYHRSPLQLRCHHCDKTQTLPIKCGQCHAVAMQPVGLGTQRLEEMLSTHFPDIPIIRMDRDSTRRKHALQDLLQQINTEKTAILLGTQMLAKGHHFPRVTLVGIVDADAGFFSADFRATEQMGQLLLQVSGRAGRAEKPGTVMIQTRHPEHPLLQTLIQQGYATFAETLLVERLQAALPPFTYLAVFRAEAYVEKNVQDFLLAIKSLPVFTETIKVLGPVMALLPKRKGLHRQHLVLKATRREQLQQCLQKILPKLEDLGTGVKWGLDVDPLEV